MLRLPEKKLHLGCGTLILTFAALGSRVRLAAPLDLKVRTDPSKLPDDYVSLSRYRRIR